MYEKSASNCLKGTSDDFRDSRSRNSNDFEFGFTMKSGDCKSLVATAEPAG